jgi:hypothetical protein
MRPRPNNGILPLVPRPVDPAKAEMTKLMKHVTPRGVDVHHLNDAGKYLHGAPPPPSFPRPTTLGDPSTPHVDSSQIN